VKVKLFSRHGVFFLDVKMSQKHKLRHAWRASGLRHSGRRGQAIIETDSARIVQMMKEVEDRSAISFIMAEAKDHANLPVNWRIVKVKRECNLVAHELASLARRNTHTAVWLGHSSTCVADLINDDCKPSV
jgi:hypothetical protein